MESTKRQRLERLFGDMGEKGEVNGVLMAAEHGEIIYQAAFGEADLSKGRRLTTNSVFELASLSKPFTALGVIVLKEQGKLAYDDLIERWVPELPYKGVTVRQLLCHTSGLPDYMDLFFEHWDRTRIATNADVLELLIQHRPPVYFEPNENWLYSNTGYVLLAIIIERVTGQRFADFMKESVFSPLGMTDTRIYNRRYRWEAIPDYAFGYIYDLHSARYELPDDVPETNYVVFLDGIQGDGTVNSNLTDLLKLDRALYAGELVSKQALEEAFAPVRLNNGETFDYGFGWILEANEGKGRAVSHSGGWPGYATNLIRYIDADRTLIYLSNMEQDVEFNQAILAAAEQILFDLPYDTPRRPEQRKLAVVDPGLYERYVGTYRLDDSEGGGEGTAAVVLVEEDRLYLQITGKVRLELYPANETRFFVRSVPVEVKFVVQDGEDKAEKLVIFQEGTETQAVRID
ncbi:serine hydrolase [Paenibacillus sp. J2TS4]|uniref:serine hydrolase n=1 Tax=Paenibacillus sp. J2TS4 TaxID=2807194 RepID=UPI001B132FCD|nr:serine hydrolase [Paenibacillus sp. J2TS4]GIP36531.1 penicillin-binding protein 4* [Paenibacillus sp. J2TS4]